MFFKTFPILALAAVVLGLPAEHPSSPAPFVVAELTVTNTLRNPHFTVSEILPFTEAPGPEGIVKKQEPTGTFQAPPPSLTGSPNWPHNYPIASGSWPTFPYSSGPPTFVTSATA
ncbi:hypothetical protein F5Y06DRAFT_259539 [Hypoxylon sp. FL0890]|nr:hypothetical protein F5Y06DRAFT_259539 [Hypoxylon sp. FL0890]